MSRPKLNMPLKEQNSPRSQWISNVSLLKNQLKDGELIESRKRNTESTATKLTWTELEAQLGKRMREKESVTPNTSARATTSDRSKLPTIDTSNPLKPMSGGGKRGGSAVTSNGNNPLSPTSNTLNLIPHPRHSPTRSTTTTMNAPLPPGIPASPSKRPTLNIPTSPRSQDVLKQVHSGTAQLPSETSNTTLSRNKPVTMTNTSARTKVGPKDADGKYNHSMKYESTFTESSSLRKKMKQHQPSPPSEAPVLKSIKDESNPAPMIMEVIHESQDQCNDNDSKESNSRLTRNTLEPHHQNTISEANVVKNRETQNPTPPSSREPEASEGPNQTEPEGRQIRPQRTRNKVPRPETTTSKTKGSMSWLRRALKPNSSKPTKRSITMSTMTEVSILTTDDSLNTKSSSKNGYSTSSKSNGKSVKTVVEKYFHPTTPLQLGLWLSEVQKAIRLAKQNTDLPVHTKTIDNHVTTTPMRMVDALPSSPQPRTADNKVMAQTQHGDGTIYTLGEGEDVYYHKNRDIGAYVDYSTFDDGDSVSSIELLFKWLTCRDLNDTATIDNGSRHSRGDRTAMTPPGTVIATESNVSDELSIDLDAKPTRRTFFSR